jgi:hypothetical protein
MGQSEVVEQLRALCWQEDRNHRAGLVTACFAAVNLWRFCGVPEMTGQILNAYREMHWESGLSLIPTWLLVLLALFLWVRQASQATAMLYIEPVLPNFSNDLRISNASAICINDIARPMPSYASARWLWWSWVGGVIAMVLFITFLPSFRAVTTLESHAATQCFLYASAIIASLMLLDVFQFLWLWNELRKLLRALNSCAFKRSFVPIEDFKWSGLWSFSGVSFYDQRVVLAALTRAAEDLNKGPLEAQVSDDIEYLTGLRFKYRTGTGQTSIVEYRRDLKGVFLHIAKIGKIVASAIASDSYHEPQKLSFEEEAKLRVLACQCEKRSRFSGEVEDVARLEDWQQKAEKFICLMYIAFIQTVIARLHGLMFSVASVFSLIALAIAVYPFAPMSPFYFSGLILFPLLTWAFFHVFSQMDMDPILSRITNGDDRKLEWNFYGKLAESLALPVLTLASSLMPGGVGRILDVTRTLLSHSQ